jgi:hypothetical protein
MEQACDEATKQYGVRSWGLYLGKREIMLVAGELLRVVLRL